MVEIKLEKKLHAFIDMQRDLTLLLSQFSNTIHQYCVNVVTRAVRDSLPIILCSMFSNHLRTIL